MRIVGGRFRGRTLAAPKSQAIRPTADRLRESLFNILAHAYGDPLEGARVLDLFAGTGALGIEALSRGAASATFVDADARAVAAIKKNTQATGLADRSRVVQADVLRYLGERQGQVDPPAFDIAFADPPYAWEEWPELLAVVPARIVAIEARAHVALPPEWHPLRSKRYGDTVVTLARRAEGE